MPASKTIVVGGPEPGTGRTVTVSEMTVETLLRVPLLLGAICSGHAETAVMSLVMGQAGEEGKALLPAVSDLGEEIHTLGGSDFLAVLSAWAEVNAGFFDALRALWGKVTGTGDDAATDAPREQAA